MDAGDLYRVRTARRAVFYYTSLGGGSAHVERDQIRLSKQTAVEARRERPGGGAGFQHSHRSVARGVGVHHATGGVHHQQATAVTLVGELTLYSMQIVRHGRLNVAVGDGGRGAFVLVDDRGDFGRERQAQVGTPLADAFRERAFVIGVAVGVQQRYGDRLDALLYERVHQVGGVIQVYRHQRPTVAVYAFVHLGAQVSRR